MVRAAFSLSVKVVILSVIRIQSGYYYPSIFAIVKACRYFIEKVVYLQAII